MTTPKLHLLRRAAAVAVATATISLAFTAPADAAPTPVPSGASAAAEARDIEDCPVNYACLWTETGWTGDRWQGTGNNVPVRDFINNLSLSTYNNSSRVACFWNSPNGTGERMREVPYSRRRNLVLDPKPSGGNWAREISAVTWNNC